MSEDTCAVWIWRYGRPDYELADSEEEAARIAVSIEDAESGAIAGVQFSDGRVIRSEEWAAFKAESDRRFKEWREQVAQAPAVPPTPKRMVQFPFGSDKVEIEADEPGWLGVQ